MGFCRNGNIETLTEDKRNKDEELITSLLEPRIGMRLTEFIYLTKQLALRGVLSALSSMLFSCPDSSESLKKASINTVREDDYFENLVGKGEASRLRRSFNPKVTDVETLFDVFTSGSTSMDELILFSFRREESTSACLIFDKNCHD
jgi:hypothetical protein